jgi:hypothetical protein
MRGNGVKGKNGHGIVQLDGAILLWPEDKKISGSVTP